MLKNRLLDNSLSHGSIELYLKCSNLIAIGWGVFQPFCGCTSLLRVDLSGCPKLESIPELAFTHCYHLVSVVFGEHSKITNLEWGAFENCLALTSITLPSKLKIELADTAGYTSLVGADANGNEGSNGEGVVPHLIARFEKSERKRYVLLALMRFKITVHTHDGTEKEKVAAAQLHHPRPPSMPHPSCFTCKAKRRPTRMLGLCAGCNKTWFCHRQ